MKKCWSILLFIIVSGSCHSEKWKNTNSREQHTYADKVVKKYYTIHNGFTSPKDAWGNYTLDLTFEAMLTHAGISNNRGYIDSVKSIMTLRNLIPSDTLSYKTQPFSCITFALFEATLDSAYLPGFLHETNKMIREAEFSKEGGVLHGFKGKQGMLIDYVQEYATRLAKAGFVTGNKMYYEKAVRQFEIYDSLVRHPETGLYSQGKDFTGEDSISPHAWSRGQGWILRGMVSTMTYLPENSTYAQRMQNLLVPYVDSLIQYQGDSGLWHQLVDLPFQDSYPETTGTGFIAYYLAVAIKNGFLPEEPYSQVVKNSINGIKKRISTNGSIQGGCPGPGPIVSKEKYYKNPGLENEPHSFATTIYALAGEKLLHNTD